MEANDGSRRRQEDKEVVEEPTARRDDVLKPSGAVTATINPKSEYYGRDRSLPKTVQSLTGWRTKQCST